MIFGDLVPFDKMWRTGANKNTILTTSDLMIFGKDTLQAGKYAIFAKPMKGNAWEMYFYTDTENWGTPEKWDASKVAVKTMATSHLTKDVVESFTISIDNVDSDAADLSFAWDKTKATVSFTAPSNNGGSAITSYTATSNPGGFTGTVSHPTSGSITVTGLTNRTAYSFKITATNAIGTSAESSTSASVTPKVPGEITYTILDQYTNLKPTGTSYNNNTYYDQYIDAGSIDASPFIITKQTNHEGDIWFYGTTELKSKANENTFRLAASTGNFDFISFNLDGLEVYINDGEESLSTIPKITLTSSSGSTVSYQAKSEESGVYTRYTYSFTDSGVKTLNWNNVEWVDIKTQYTKAKTKDYDLKEL